VAWVGSNVAATVLMTWAIGARSPGHLLPAVFALAVGFHASMQGRRQTRLIAGYVEEFLEGRGHGPQWHTRLGRLQVVPTVASSDDWIIAGLANLGVLATIVLAWLYAGGAQRGELMASLLTAGGVAFALHSVTETARLQQTDFAAAWRRTGAGPAEVGRQDSAAA
jgi:hypothetical protein